MKTSLLRLPLALATLGTALSAHAQLIGSSVTGTIRFGTYPVNYFDPANGYVPNGYLNKTQGATVTVAEPAIEFGTSSEISLDAVNVSASGITLASTVYYGHNGSLVDLFTVTLASPAFSNLAFVKTGDTLANGGVAFSRSGNTLTFVVPQISAFTGDVSGAATFAAIPVPEPAPLCALVVPALALLRRRARR